MGSHLVTKCRSTIIQILALCLSLTSLVQASLGAKTRHYYEFEVEYMFGSPDCVERMVMGINGQFPGPTIRGKAGDTIHVKVINRLHTEGVTIHWHGIRQIGTPWSDGTASISQCPINVGESFEYWFVVDKTGTFFYHGHFGMQRTAGLYGSLIVDPAEGQKEPFQSDGEFNLLFSDWWHTTVQEQETGLTVAPTRDIGEPQSLLINGRGQFNCSLAGSDDEVPPCNFTAIEKCAPQPLQVLPNKTYRIRFASITSLAHVNVQIENHNMTVVEAGGNYVQPFETSDIDLFTGESYSVLLRTDQDPSKNYWVAVYNRLRVPQSPPALTILQYKASTSMLPTSTPPPPPTYEASTRIAFARKVPAAPESPKPPKTSDRRIFILNTQNRFNGVTRMTLNNVSLALPPTPYLGAITISLMHLIIRHHLRISLEIMISRSLLKP